MKYLASFVFALACNDSTGTQPNPPLTSEAGTPSPAAPLRTVGHRNPFGDVVQSDNLLADGDFELTGRTDQAPWIVFTQGAQGTLTYDTGGRCRSGVRCAVLAAGQQLHGYMATPISGQFEVRIYIQPDSGRCADANVMTYDFGSNTSGDSIHSVGTDPDATGWCLFQGSGSADVYGQPAIYIEVAQNATSKTIHIDQASALPVNEAPAHNAKVAPQTPPPEMMKRAHAVADWLRKHRKFGRPTTPTQGDRPEPIGVP